MSAYARRELAQLAHQLKLSPKRLRPAQIAGAERMLRLVRNETSYPYDLVCYQVTGYESTKARSSTAIPADALVGDLVQLIDDLTRTAPLRAQDYAEPILPVADLAQRLNVSTKTVSRWRKKGLVCRRVLNGDGKTHLAVLESDVRRFVHRHRAAVQRAAAFKQLDDSEKASIVEQARDLLAERRVRLHELAQTLSERTGRAVETIRYTLRRHDAENPGTALFSDGQQPTVDPTHQRIFSLHQQGTGVAALATQFSLTQKAVRNVMQEMRCRRLLNLPIDYIYNAEFDAPDAETLILGERLELPSRDGDRNGSKAGASLPPYLRELFKLPVLTREQEADLFRRYNYIKFRAKQLRDALDPLSATDGLLDQVEGLLDQADTIKNELVRCNLRLVVSIAKRHVHQGPDFFEIVSDGNVALMRAVEKFDYARGHKFSTYASWSVMRSYARSIPEAQYRSRRFVSSAEEIFESVPDAGVETVGEIDQQTSVREAVARAMRSLDSRERTVVARHFGLGGDGSNETLEQIGKLIGVTKERVRQIERKALEKLRAVLPPSAAELLD